MKKIIVAFCGFAGSGKDTACDYLDNYYGYERTSFAAPLKEMVKIAFGFSDDQLYGPSSKREEEDLRYPFSGTCLRCGRQCQMAFVAKHGNSPYWCKACDAHYPAFINARIALQTLGTEWGRRLHDDIWAKAALNKIMASDMRCWCISDLRFVNELDAVKAVGGYVVRLMRGERKSSHASEAELDSIPLTHFDKVIENHGTLEELYSTLRDYVESIEDAR